MKLAKNVRLLIYISTLLQTVSSFSAAEVAPEKKAHYVSLGEKREKFFDKEGHLHTGKVAKFLEKAYKQRAVSAPELSNSEKLEVKKLEEEQKEAKWKTTQLFLIKGPHNKSFILKGLTNSHEIENLVKGATSNRFLPFLYPNQNTQYPQFVFPITFLRYKDKKAKEHKLSLMPFAPGKSLVTLMKDFKKNPKDRALMRTIAYAYFDLGKQMANFYQFFAGSLLGKSIIHGDLHQGNIFYDSLSRRITLIDNERVAKSLENRADICIDIAFLLMKSMFVMQWVKPKLLKEFPFKEWYSLYVPNFIAGFLSAYPERNRPAVYQFLEDCIRNYKDENRLVWYTDKNILKNFSHKDYIEPILNRLKASKILFNIDPNTINKSDQGGKTLLHHAALLGESLMIWPLIAAKANIEARDNDQNTPLHEASYLNHSEVIKALVRAGANLYAKDKNNMNSLEKAQNNNSKDAIFTLKDYMSRN